MSSVGVGKTFTGVFVASAVLVSLFVSRAPRYDAKGTFRTTDLVVDNTSKLDGNIISDNTNVVFGQPIMLNPQLSENVSGVIWNDQDMRTDHNLEVGSVATLGGGISGVNYIAVAGSIVFSQAGSATTPNESLFSGLAQTGSAADSQDITISAAGSNGTIILQGDTDVGSNAGQGGVKIKSGGPSPIQVWSVDKTGHTSQPSDATIGGSVGAGGAVTAGAYVDAHGEIYADSDNVYLRGGGINCGWSTASTTTCTVNDYSEGDAQGQFRNFDVRNGKGVSQWEVFGTTGHIAIHGTAQSSGNLSACGTGGTEAVTAGSTDVQGQITEATGATGCVLAFNGTWTVAPFCTCTATTAIAVGCTATATALTIVNASAAGDVITYRCNGVTGST